MKKQNRLQLIGTAIKQRIQVAQLKKQRDQAYRKIHPIFEENNVLDINAFVESWKKNPTSCKITVFDIDYGTPVLLSDSGGNDTFSCPEYNPEKPCEKHECKKHPENAAVFDLQKQYEQAKKALAETRAQLFGSRNK